MPDDSDPVRELFGEVIFSYTTEQAVADGVLVPVGTHRFGNGEAWPVYFAASLWEQGYKKSVKRREVLVKAGIELLKRPDPEDTDYMRLRVIRDGRLWVIAEPGKLTYLKPSDY